jgi:hypothetical protein
MWKFRVALWAKIVRLAFAGVLPPPHWPLLSPLANIDGGFVSGCDRRLDFREDLYYC